MRILRVVLVLMAVVALACVGLAAVFLPGYLETRRQHQARAALQRWVVRASQHSAAAAEQDWSRTRALLDKGFERLPPLDLGLPAANLSVKYAAEGNYARAHQLRLQCLKIWGMEPSNYDMFIASLAGDCAWLQARAEKESSPHSPHAAYLRTVSLWARKDFGACIDATSVVLRLADEKDLPGPVSADLAWVVFLRAKALDAKGQPVLAAKCMDLLDVNSMGEWDCQLQVFTTGLQILIRAGRWKEAKEMIQAVRTLAAQAQDVSWDTRLQSLDRMERELGPVENNHGKSGTLLLR